MFSIITGFTFFPVYLEMKSLVSAMEYDTCRYVAEVMRDMKVVTGKTDR